MRGRAENLRRGTPQNAKPTTNRYGGRLIARPRILIPPEWNGRIEQNKFNAGLILMPATPPPMTRPTPYYGDLPLKFQEQLKKKSVRKGL